MVRSILAEHLKQDILANIREQTTPQMIQALELHRDEAMERRDKLFKVLNTIETQHMPNEQLLELLA